MWFEMPPMTPYDWLVIAFVSGVVLTALFVVLLVIERR